MIDLAPMRIALRTLSRLKDAEQYFVWGWLATGARNYLYRAGISDAHIGAKALFPEDRRMPYDGPSARPSTDLLQSIERLRDLPGDHLLALRDWYLWHNREPLYRLDLTDADIGSPRVMPDDIWPYEAAYPTANDGTLEFHSDSDGAVNVRAFLNGAWQDP
jgi:hypothetical protein